MRLIAIDPGKHAVGWATFEEDSLMRCGYQLRDNLPELFSRIMTGIFVWIEKPQVYQQRAWRGDPNDLIDVAMAAGNVEQLVRDAGADVNVITPHTWKGNAKKEIMTRHIKNRMTKSELKTLDGCGVSRSKQHNVIDAIGIGLWRIGRLR